MRFRRLAAAMIIVSFLSGCATSGARVSSIPSALQSSTPSMVGDANNPIVVVIRWPVSVSDDARGDVINSYRAFDRMVYAQGAQTESTIEVGPEMSFTSSTYYAAELAEAVRRAMPNARIIMQPVRLDTGNSGTVIETTPSEDTLPSTLIINLVDHNGGKFPFLATMFSYTLRTAPYRSTENCGLLVAMEEEISRSPAQQINISCDSTQAEKAPNPLWYLGFSEDTPKKTSFKTTESLPLSTHAVAVYPPTQLFSMTIFQANIPDYVRKSRPNNESDVKKVLLHPHLVNLANTVSSAPAVLEQPNLTNREIVEYIAFYDDQLAHAVRQGRSLSQPEERNIQTIRKLLNSELNIRAERDRKLATTMLTGPFGKSFRNQRDKSYEGFNSMMSASWASAAMITASSPAASSPMGMLSRNMTMLEQHSSNMDQAGLTIYDAFNISLDSLENEYINFDGEQVAINQKKQGSLRTSLAAIYNKHKIK